MHADPHQADLSRADSAAPVASDTSLSSLLGGIVTDLQKLLDDHLHLLRLEVEEDFQKSKQALLPWAVGVGLMLVALLLSICATVGWLAWLHPDIPWFGWAGISAGVILVFGLILFIIARQRWRLVNPLPDKTLRSVKKTFQRIQQQVNTEPT